MIVVPNRWGELIPAEKVNIANHLWNIRQSQPLWKVVEEVIKVWKQTNPKKWDAYIIHLDGVKRSQRWTSVGNKSFRGVSVDRSEGRTRGMTTVMQVDFPVWIMQCLRKLYTEDELCFSGERGKKFFREFGRRFPLFRILQSA